jgi:hypothetical protein
MNICTDQQVAVLQRRLCAQPQLHIKQYNVTKRFISEVVSLSKDDKTHILVISSLCFFGGGYLYTIKIKITLTGVFKIQY